MGTRRGAAATPPPLPRRGGAAPVASASPPLRWTPSPCVLAPFVPTTCTCLLYTRAGSGSAGDAPAGHMVHRDGALVDTREHAREQADLRRPHHRLPHHARVSPIRQHLPRLLNLQLHPRRGGITLECPSLRFGCATGGYAKSEPKYRKECPGGRIRPKIEDGGGKNRRAWPDPFCRLMVPCVGILAATWGEFARIRSYAKKERPWRERDALARESSSAT